MICEFQKQNTVDYTSKPVSVFKEVTDKRKPVDEKNVSTTLENRDDGIKVRRNETTMEVTMMKKTRTTKKTRTPL